ncbi:XTP/dITP diphosphatase [Bacillus pumilus]|uniref:XTP/dITP diphosphatase n=1 Tax=Bacillus pumilus TaxID=1408 RepID=UPI002B2552FF|nr:XTP/dITP diphosphatase [Bacillus pumilus]MEB2358589.1 XTP/dITP diphosphatase [Bacillus pumilus]
MIRMKTAIIATHNAGKAKEFKAILEPKGFTVKTLADIGFTEEIEETGHTFEENAIIKAEAIQSKAGEMVIADDSGLSIDYLGGKPGVYSARYAGEHKNDAENVEKVLSELQGIEKEDRTARFRCALAVSIPGKETKTVEGSVEGFIAEEPIGENGFGYDPIFIVKDKDQTMAELSPEEKNKISHRAVALQKLSSLLDANE